MRRTKRFSISTLLGFVTLVYMLPAKAHDTWFVPNKMDTSYHLNTGSHFPKRGGPVPYSRVEEKGCLGPDGELTGVIGQGSDSEFIVSLPDVESNTQGVCWASLKLRSIKLNANQVKRYLAETKADKQWQQYYKQQQAQGNDWIEFYRKSARMELTPELSDSVVDLPLQARLAPTSTNGSATAGEPITLQVLLKGQSLANQPVELLVDNAPIGVWYKTDENGMVEVTPPVAGQALLRGTHFALKNDLIRTEFLTYTFPVLP